MIPITLVTSMFQPKELNPRNRFPQVGNFFETEVMTSS